MLGRFREGGLEVRVLVDREATDNAAEAALAADLTRDVGGDFTAEAVLVRLGRQLRGS